MQGREASHNRSGQASPRYANKLHLSPQRQRMVECFQNLNFGRVEKVVVREGDPVFDPPPRVVHVYKLGAENTPRTERSAVDFELKRELVDLFNLFDRLRNVCIDVIEVRHGLPFVMTVHGSTE